MQRKYNKELVPAARQLRKAMTKEERRLWFGFLRGYPVRFTRQKVLGKYVADFYCAKAKLVIELDGSQHYEAAGLAKDAERTAYLEDFGLSVVRLSNGDVNRDFAGVCAYVDDIVKRSV